MKIKELYAALNEKYPTALSCEWDNDGIMCADNLDRRVEKVLVALDVTENTVDYAINNGFDLIISHHPLVFSSQKSLVETKYTQRKLIKLIKAGVSVFSFHTRLDAVSGGVNDVLSNLIGLESVEADAVDPVGRIGALPKEIELSTVAENVKAKLDTPVVLYNGNKTVKKVYDVGGDGKSLISRAFATGCDTLLTGRVSYNTLIDARDMGLNIVEAGHFFTENPVCAKIKDDVLEIDPSIDAQIFNSFEIKAV
jgi:dinuclear metal center YbgI/SA1388 family protein